MAFHRVGSFALLALFVCSIPQNIFANRASLEVDLESDQKHMEVTQMDKNGFCPEVKFGGGKGNSEPIHMKSDMIMVKILWAEHLPSGGGVFSEDVPDTLIKFGIDSEKAQSSFVKDAWTPFFGNTCFFSQGSGWLKMELFEEDTFTEASIGVIGMTSDGVQLTRKQCNGYGLVKKLDGECLYTLKVWNLKKMEEVKGKDGHSTTVTVGVKYIDSARNYNHALNNALLESSITESQNVGSLMESSSTEIQNMDSSAQIDKNGYCPNMIFGGGKGSDRAIPPPSSAVLVKIMSLHIPEDYAKAMGSMGDRVPDPYVTFSLKKHQKDTGKDLFKARLDEEGQTQAFENKRDATFHFECALKSNSISGATILFKLWDWDTLSKDDLFGVLELPVSKSQCNDDGSGECIMTKKMQTKKPKLGAPTITISLKFVEVMPQGMAPAPLSLGL